MMKILNRTILVILVTICAMGKGLIVYAESNTPAENRVPKSLLGLPLFEVEKKFHLGFDASGSYGPMSGYLQTPAGGAPSSTSNKRPKFEELGIDTATMINLSLSVGRDPHSIYGAGHLVDLSGENTLDEALIFHGKGYPAGTRVKADVKLNWYEIGYQYNIHFGKERINFSIAPTIAVALWDFNTELESNGEKNSRSYMKGTPRIGLELEWYPMNCFTISGKAIGSIPLENLPHIYTVSLTGKYNILNKDRVKILLVTGVEYNHIDYKDSQTKSNHIRADMGPLGIVGAEIRF
jgi:hypothetical protein